MGNAIWGQAGTWNLSNLELISHYLSDLTSSHSARSDHAESRTVNLLHGIDLILLYTTDVLCLKVFPRDLWTRLLCRCLSCHGFLYCHREAAIPLRARRQIELHSSAWNFIYPLGVCIDFFVPASVLYHDWLKSQVASLGSRFWGSTYFPVLNPCFALYWRTCPLWRS